MITSTKPSKVALVSVGVTRSGYSQFERFMPMTAPGIYYLDEALRQRGRDVSIIDQPHAGLTDAQVSDRIRESGAQYVLFNQFFSTRERVRGFVSALRDSDNACIIGVGGHDATFHSRALPAAEFQKAYAGFDFVWGGEAESGLDPFLRQFKRESAGPQLAGSLADRAGAGMRERIGSLDSLPILKHPYSGEVGFLVTSRGCTYSCDFCTTPSFYKDGWRARSVGHVIAELNNLVSAGKKYLFICDDNFLGGSQSSLERGHEIVAACKERDLKVMIMTSKEQIMRAYEGGYLADWNGTVFRVVIGIENGDETAIKKLGKCCDAKKHRQLSQDAVSALYDAGIALFAGYINFNRESTPAELGSSAAFLRETGLEAAIFTNFCQGIRIYEGTCLFDQYKAQNIEVRIENGEHRYEFVDARVGKLYNYLWSVRGKVTDTLDNVLFELIDLIYINQLQNEKSGQRYKFLRSAINEYNYDFFMKGLRHFEKGDSLELGKSKDEFLAGSKEFLTKCKLLESEIMKSAEYV